MSAHCDHTSVGVIITNQYNEILLLERARFPFGLAPPAGHVDQHGTYRQAAVAEVFEEVGITLTVDDLVELMPNTPIKNICRRRGGSHHVWRVYAAKVSDKRLRPDPDETNGAAWYTGAEVQSLVQKTKKLKGIVTQNNMPTLEPVWVGLLERANLTL